MLRCLLGDRKSGKSVFVENQVKRIDRNALYVATLPELSRYRETIMAHQKRRPASWRCAELFKMSIEEILAYPVQNYQNVILDNLSYYLLLQLYFNEDEFLRQCDERVFSFINEMACNVDTTVYIVDTPIYQDVLEEDDTTGIIRRLFTQILDVSAVIERFYDKEIICRLNREEGKRYLFHI